MSKEPETSDILLSFKHNMTLAKSFVICDGWQINKKHAYLIMIINMIRPTIKS